MTTLTYKIHCQRSGVQIATLDYAVVAGHAPWLSHWDGMVALHPVFSMPRAKLLAFARSEWNRLAKLAADEQATAQECTTLQVCFLAVLHSLDSIIQDAPSLPSLVTVQNNMARLFVLAFWHHYLDSKRFRFPEFKINKLNANDRFENLNYYLDACFTVKEDYETKVNEMVEQEKVIAAERALKALRNSWIVPIGNRALWRWVRANLPERFSADAQGWMSTLFLGNEKTVMDFDLDEVELLEQIIVGECPQGTAILKAVRDRIEQIRQTHISYKEAFTVDFTSYESTATLTQPRPQDYPTKVAYIKANALYYLQQRAINATQTQF
jgi:hypothetical protein